MTEAEANSLEAMARELEAMENGCDKWWQALTRYHDFRADAHTNYNPLCGDTRKSPTCIIHQHDGVIKNLNGAGEPYTIGQIVASHRFRTIPHYGVLVDMAKADFPDLDEWDIELGRVKTPYHLEGLTAIYFLLPDNTVHPDYLSVGEKIVIN